MKKITDGTEEDKSYVLDVIAETLKSSNRRKLCILFGAGASVSGGIDLANKIAADIRKDPQYAIALKALKPDDGYPQIMARLTGAQRRRILAAQIEKADINWAHLMLAEFLAQGAADRLLTVNFDPLLLRAAGLVGTLPAVYDFSLSTTFNPSGIQYPAVFYLHGQHTSFVQLHTGEQVTNESRKIEPIITDCIADRPVLIVGYSGYCDPVFEALGRLPSFDNRLFWIGYKDGDPPVHVREHVLSKDGAHWIKGFDADQFLVRLADRLGFFPPSFLKNPFSFLNDRLSEIADFPLNSDHGVTDPMKSIAPLIQQAVQLETTPGKPRTTLAVRLMLGQYDKIISSLPDDINALSVEEKEAASWAYFMKGNDFLERGKQTNNAESDALLWESTKNFAAAINIKPDNCDALNNWGSALATLARRMEGLDAENLLQKAIEKFSAAIDFNPDLQESQNNWAIALTDLAAINRGSETEILLQQAFEKFSAAIEKNPDNHECLSNWAVALLVLAETKDGPTAEPLFQQAFEKYAAAIEVNPDSTTTLNNWGIGISKLARRKSGPEAEALFKLAFEKFDAAINIKPNDHEVLSNWGTALSDLASRKAGPESEKLFQEALEKYSQADQLVPRISQYNRACLFAIRGMNSEARQCLTEAATSGVSWPGSEHARKDDDLVSIRDEPWFIDLLRDHPDPVRKR